MRIFILLFYILLVVLGQKTFAQETVFLTKVSSSKAGVQDAFQITYEIKNAGQVSKFIQPNLSNFVVLNGPNQSSNISMFNGDVTQTLSFSYLVQCKKLGTTTIPPASAMVDGKAIRSNSTTVEIVTGSIAKQLQKQQRNNNPLEDILNGQDPLEEFFNDPAFNQSPFHRNNRVQASPTENISKEDINKNIFIKVDVDKTTAQVGEQLTACYKLYTRIPMQMNLSKLPSLNGFWSQDFSIPNPPTPTREVVNGIEYQVFLIKKSALFPTQAGSLTLDAAQAEGTARVVKKQSDSEPNNIFENGTSSMQQLINSFFRKGLGSDLFSGVEYEDVPVTIASKPIAIKVNEIPQTTKPSSFNGAIGSYTIESNIDKTEITTDETCTITLTIRGTGNLKLMGAPVVNFPTDFQTYDPKIKDTITSNDNTIAGYKTFKYTCEPTIVGEFTVPSTAFSYYDPALQAYKTLNTPSYIIHVKEGKNYITQNRLPKDIHDIQSQQIELVKDDTANWTTSPLYWMGYAIPLLSLLTLSFFKSKNEKLKSDVTKYKQKQANKIALKRLINADEYLQQQLHKPFYEEISKAMWLYLSDKLNIPLSLLNKQNIKMYLQQKKVDSTTTKKLIDVLNECEIALYSRNNASTQMQETYQNSLSLIGTLEDIL